MLLQILSGALLASLSIEEKVLKDGSGSKLDEDVEIELLSDCYTEVTGTAGCAEETDGEVTD